jgi:ATP-dependent Clp protease ATP-binding subunit ClpB
MNFSCYTEKSRLVLHEGQTLASRSNHQRYTCEHLFLALLKEESGLASRLLGLFQLSPESLQKEVLGALSKLPLVEGSGAGQLFMDPVLIKALEQAEKDAESHGDRFVSLERLLAALLVTPGSSLYAYAQSQGVSGAKIHQALETFRQGRKVDSEAAEDSFEALNKYARDMTALAREGK